MRGFFVLICIVNCAQSVLSAKLFSARKGRFLLLFINILGSELIYKLNPVARLLS